MHQNHLRSLANNNFIIITECVLLHSCPVCVSCSVGGKYQCVGLCIHSVLCADMGYIPGKFEYHIIVVFPVKCFDVLIPGNTPPYHEPTSHHLL